LQKKEKYAMVGRCPSCLAKFLIEDSKVGPTGLKMPCSKCGAIFPVMPPQGPESAASASSQLVRAGVLIAHDSHAFCNEARRVLEESQHDIEIVVVHDGEELLSCLESESLDVALVEMMLPGMFGFQVAAKIKNDEALAHIKVILASGIYQPLGFKPEMLTYCGADDYIENHQVQNMLVGKLVNLLGGEGRDPLALKVDSEPVQESPDDKSVSGKASGQEVIGQPADVSKEHKRAQRLARIIVSDIALYNKEAIEKGLKNGKIMKVLEKDLKEARALYVKRVPEDIRLTTNYLGDELQALFDKKRQECHI
jgi:predicted Zn finger-like uncharacterized protein